MKKNKQTKHKQPRKARKGERSTRAHRNCYQRGQSDREREKEVGRAELSGGEGDTCGGATRIDIVLYSPSGDSLRAEEKRTEDRR